MNNEYLAHHGVLGMKWGVRRYQNEDGSLTNAGKKRYANKYNYKDSESYKNASRGNKAVQTNTYNSNKYFFGEKAANRIEYKVNEEGIDRKTATRPEAVKAVVKSVAIIAAAYATPVLIAKGSTWYETKKREINLNNTAASVFAEMNGIPINDKKGFGLGMKEASMGRKVYEAFTKKGY